MSASELAPVADLARQSVSWSDLAERAVISTQAELDTAAQYLRGIKALRDEIAKTFDPIIETAHKAHKKAIEQRKIIEAPLIDAKTLLDRKVGTYAAKIEREAREERERQERAAREERERQEKLAREEREQAEAAAKAAREAGDTARAQTFEADAQAAAELEHEVAQAPPPYVPPPMPVRAFGVSTRDTYKFEVTDLGALVAAVAAGRAPLRFLLPNEVQIGAEARASKGELELPGVRVYVDKSVVTR